MINSDKTILVVRWIARIGAGLTAVFTLFMFVGSVFDEGIQPLLHLTARESVMMAAFGIMWLGLVLGWKWERIGGALAVGGMIAFYLFDYAFSGELPRSIIFFVLAFPGILFLYCEEKKKRSTSGNE